MPDLPFPIRKYSRWLYQHVHRYEWGLDRGKGPFHINRKDDLNWSYATRSTRYRKKLTEKWLVDHLGKREKVYYTASGPNKHNGHQRCLLLMVDIDAHEDWQIEARDAMDAAKWIRDVYFPDAYFEPSTGGLGAHLYILLEWPRMMGTAELRERLRVVANALATVTRAEGWAANVCGICGVPSIQDGGQIVTCGILGKIPRPQTVGDLEALVNMPAFLWDSLRLIVEDNNRLVHQSEALTPTVVAPTAPPLYINSKGFPRKKDDDDDKDPDSDQDSPHPLHPDTPSYIPNSIGPPVSASPPERCSNESLKDECMGLNAWERTMVAALHLYRMTWVSCQRPPTPAELLAFYLANQLQTGDEPRPGIRLRRCQDAIRTVARSFDPQKIGSPYSATPTRYLDILKAAVPLEALKTPKARLITYEDLNWFLGCCVRNAFHPHPPDPHSYIPNSIGGQTPPTPVEVDSGATNGCTSRHTVIQWFRHLKATGQHDRSCDEDKYRGMLNVCLQYKLLDLYQPHVPPTYRPKMEGWKMGWLKVNGKGRWLIPGIGLGGLRLDWERLQALVPASAPVTAALAKVG